MSAYCDPFQSTRQGIIAEWTPTTAPGMSLTTLNFALLLTLAGHYHNPVCTVTLPVFRLSPSATHFFPTSHFLYSSLSSIPLSHLLYRPFFTQSSYSSLVGSNLLILLGNIHLNSAPPPSVNAFTLCYFNI